MMIKRMLPWTGIAILSLAPLTVYGEGEAYPPRLGTQFVIDNDDPEKNLPSDEQIASNPLEWGYLLMDLDERADIATKRGDWNAALKFHRAAARLVPDRSVSFGLLCKDYEMLGRREEALLACGKAVALSGAKLDYFVQFVHLVANRPGGLDDAEVKDALAAIEHLKKEKNSELAGYELECELSLKTLDDAALEKCSTVLSKRLPEAPRPVTFAWALALRQGKFERARQLMDEAKRKGATESVLSKMEKTTQAAIEGKPFASDEGERRNAAPSNASPPPGGPSRTDSHSPGDRREESGALMASSGSLLSAHPAMAWLVGLCIALLLSVMIARRLARPRSR